MQAGVVMKADTYFDAGDMGCGELVLELKFRMKELPAGALMHLIASDPGAPVDLPAWCKMTGHNMVQAEHPNYLIKKRES